MVGNSLANTNAYVQFGEWLQKQAYWLQDAVYCIYHNIRIDDKLIDSYVDMCIAQGKKEKPSFRHLSEIDLKRSIPSKKIAILGISDIVGVNALAPEAKLDFSATGVNVIYGLNGAGKSGYMRIFKQLSGSPYEEAIQPNVFAASSAVKPSCIFNLQINDEKKPNIKCELSAKTKDSILAECDVFDTRISVGYISKDNTPSFKPFVFQVLTELSTIAGQVSNHILSRIAALSPIDLPIPSELSFDDDLEWVKSISATTAVPPLFTQWTDAQEKRLNELPSLLDDETVKKSLELCRIQKSSLVPIYNDLLNASSTLSSCEIDDIYKTYVTTKNRYEIAKSVFSESANPKDKISVSSRDWKILWETAQHYYESNIYEKGSKHFGEEGSICPLCHQILVPPYSIRFKSVNEYVNSSCSEAYKHACSDLGKAIFNICNRSYNEITSDQIPAGILNEVEYAIIQETYKNILKIKNENIVDIESAYQQMRLLNLKTPVTLLFEKIKSLNETSIQLEEIIKGEKHLELEKEFNHLVCYKWVCDHFSLLSSKISQLQEIDSLNKALAYLNTNKITSESNKLAEALLTEAYLHQFDLERQRLAPKIKVRLEKIPSKKGKTPYKIVLDAPSDHIKPSPEYILSEGEQRIVALAEFFADAVGRENSTPLIIDDPISSLDIEYEKKATQRIVEFAHDRQVIIFTHRISLLQGLSEVCKQNGVECKAIFIRSSVNGKGILDNSNTYLGSIKEQLKLFSQQIPDIRKKDPESAEYRASLNEIYQQFRICVERSVEDVLLQGMIKRFDHIIHTNGKLTRLTRITDEDCKIIDSMMTKYSFKEHSQPVDGPLVEITVDELEQDITKFKEWIAEYNKRFNQ